MAQRKWEEINPRVDFVPEQGTEKCFLRVAPDYLWKKRFPREDYLLMRCTIDHLHSSVDNFYFHGAEPGAKRPTADGLMIIDRSQL